MISGVGGFGYEEVNEAVARVRLPMTLREGLHGNWVDSGDVDGHPIIATAVNVRH
jgi:hypothetical protein